MQQITLKNIPMQKPKQTQTDWQEAQLARSNQT